MRSSTGPIEFFQVCDSVEAELHGEGGNVGQMADAPQLPIPPAQPQQNKAGYSKNGKSSDTPASPKQIKYLLDIARQIGYTVEQLKAKFNVPALESLTKTQCSRAIDELNGKAA